MGTINWSRTYLATFCLRHHWAGWKENKHLLSLRLSRKIKCQIRLIRPPNSGTKDVTEVDNLHSPYEKCDMPIVGSTLAS